MGQVVIEAGAMIGAREVALLAAVGKGRIGVRPRPRVVVISTGTELVDPGDRLKPGLIPDSNGYMLTAAAHDAGALAFRAGPVADEQQALTETLEDQLVRADLVVTTGGITAGTYDTLKVVLSRLGSVEFCDVAMAPGRAHGFGYLGPDEIPIFSLPGNPESAFVAFELFVRPMIRRLHGHHEIFRPLVQARLGTAVTGRPGLRSYVRGHLHGSAQDRAVVPISEQGLIGLRLADCLIVLPENTGAVPAGAIVSVLPFGRR